MEKDFIPYDLALEMKELGFDEPCFGFYRIYTSGNIKLIISYEKLRHVEAPTFSQCFRWFRENYNKLSAIDHSLINGWFFVIREIGGTTDPMLNAVSVGNFITYEEAEQECLKQLIKIVKDEQ